MMLKSSVSGMLGYFAGTFFKQQYKIILWWGGVVFTFFGSLNYLQYIRINWQKIDSDIF